MDASDQQFAVLIQAHQDAVIIWLSHADRQVGRAIRDKAFIELAIFQYIQDEQQNH